MARFTWYWNHPPICVCGKLMRFVDRTESLTADAKKRLALEKNLRWNRATPVERYICYACGKYVPLLAAGAKLKEIRPFEINLLRAQMPGAL